MNDLVPTKRHDTKLFMTMSEPLAVDVAERRLAAIARRRIPLRRECVEAIVLRLEHPHWPHQKIADAIGVHLRQLFDWPQYVRLNKLFEDARMSSADSDALAPEHREIRM